MTKQVEAVSVEQADSWQAAYARLDQHLDENYYAGARDDLRHVSAGPPSQSPLSVDEGRVEEVARAIHPVVHLLAGPWPAEEREAHYQAHRAQLAKIARAALSATPPKAPLPEGSEELVERLLARADTLEVLSRENRALTSEYDVATCVLTREPLRDAAAAITTLSHQLTEALKDRDYYANRYADKCGETIVLTAKIAEARALAKGG